MSSPEDKESNVNFYIKVAYFASLASASMLFGFSLTLNKARKTPLETPEQALVEEGIALARKALFRGTVYSVCGFSIFAFTSYHLFGKKIIERFKASMKKSDEQDIKYIEDILGTKTTKTQSSKETTTTANTN